MEGPKNVTLYDDDYEINENDKDDTFLRDLNLVRNNIIICG